MGTHNRSENGRGARAALCAHHTFIDTSCLLGPNILLSTLFSNVLNLNSSLKVRHYYQIFSRKALQIKAPNFAAPCGVV
jgi:hypothetical protein